MSGAGAFRPDGDYETTEIHTYAGLVKTIRHCLHKPEHVEVVRSPPPWDEVVAHLCTDCDTELPEWWTP